MKARANKSTGRRKKKASDVEVLQQVGRFRPADTTESAAADELGVTQQGFIARMGELIEADEVIEAAVRLGAIKRQRKVDLPALVEATVAAMSPIPGAETSAFVNYLAITGVPLVPSSFYDRFSPEFAELMRELAGRAVQMVREVSPEDQGLQDYGVLLEKFDDVQAALTRVAPCSSDSRKTGPRRRARSDLRGSNSTR